jgi:hypothetical protein
VRDRQHGHIDDRDRVCDAQLLRRLFLRKHKPFWVKRYVLCSVTA